MSINTGTFQTDQNAPSSKPAFRVENWQIPVPIGDASAHFLLDTSTTAVIIASNNTTYPRVINAFFMDGGDQQKMAKYDTAMIRIQAILEIIDKNYGCDWKFDAIVTTHHDRDHYVGLQDLLGATGVRNGITDTYRKLYFQPTLTFYSGGLKSTAMPPTMKGVADMTPLEKGIYWDAKKACRYCWEPSGIHRVVDGEHCIGIDLFSQKRVIEHSSSNQGTNKKLGVSSLGDFSNLSTTEGQRPRFLVVGANGYSMGNNLVKNKPDMNETSILALVYWPATGCTSYYTGGDGSVDVLQAAAKWMKKNTTKKTPWLPTTPVNMVKLDHHGSLGEAVTEVDDIYRTVLPILQPDYVLVTPGFMHGHPNWLVLQYVQNYFEMRRETTSDSHYELFTTRSPYWLIPERVGQSGLNTNNLGNKKTIGALLMKGGNVDPTVKNMGKGWDKDKLEKGDEYTNLPEIANYNRNNWVEDNAIKKNAEAAYKDEVAEEINKNTKLPKDQLNKAVHKKLMQAQAADDRFTNGETKNNNTLSDESPSSFNSDANEITLHDRNLLQDYYRSTWAKICKQPLAYSGSPYFLVRFSFDSQSGNSNATPYIQWQAVGVATKATQKAATASQKRRKTISSTKSLLNNNVQGQQQGIFRNSYSRKSVMGADKRLEYDGLNREVNDDGRIFTTFDVPQADGNTETAAFVSLKSVVELRHAVRQILIIMDLENKKERDKLVADLQAYNGQANVIKRKKLDLGLIAKHTNITLDDLVTDRQTNKQPFYNSLNPIITQQATPLTHRFAGLSDLRNKTGDPLLDSIDDIVKHKKLRKLEAHSSLEGHSIQNYLAEPWPTTIPFSGHLKELLDWELFAKTYGGFDGRTLKYKNVMRNFSANSGWVDVPEDVVVKTLEQWNTLINIQLETSIGQYQALNKEQTANLVTVNKFLIQLMHDMGIEGDIDGESDGTYEEEEGEDTDGADDDFDDISVDLDEVDDEKDDGQSRGSGKGGSKNTKTKQTGRGLSAKLQRKAVHRKKKLKTNSDSNSDSPPRSNNTTKRGTIKSRKGATTGNKRVYQSAAGTKEVAKNKKAGAVSQLIKKTKT